MKAPPTASVDGRVQPGALVRFAAEIYLVIATIQRNEPINPADGTSSRAIVTRISRSGPIEVRSFPVRSLYFARVEPLTT